ncbi:MAG: hypothetical protein HYU98_01385 [Deltaproteobacteria bacterium]|nr:hypothetical protein [Deltaproteobacteria bacterium]
MTNKKNILPPPTMNSQKEPITVAVLSGKLDALFKNVKEMVTTTVTGTENVLRKEIETVKKELVVVKVTVEGHSNAIMDLSRELKDHGKQLAELKNDVKEIKSDVTDLKTDVKEIKTSVKLLEERSNDNERRLVTVEHRLNERISDHP